MSDKTNKNLLIVESNNSPLSVNESASKQSRMVLEGTFTYFNVKNRNDRIYTAEKFIPHMNELMERKKELKAIIGEMDHPAGFETSLKYASHTIENLTHNVNENNVSGKIKLMPTFYGEQATAIVESGVPIFVSSRAAGITESNGEVTIKKLFTYDLVADPGFAGTNMKKCMNESLGYSNNASFRIYDMDSVEDMNSYVNDRGGSGKAEQLTESHYSEYKQYVDAQIAASFQQINEMVSSRRHSEREIAELSEKIEMLKEHNENLTKHINYIASGANKLKSYTKAVDKRTSALEKHANIVTETVNDTVGYTEKIGEALNVNSDLSDKNFKSALGNIVSHVNRLADVSNANFEEMSAFKRKQLAFNEHVRATVNEAVTNVNALVDFTEVQNEALNGTMGYVDMLSNHLNHSISFTEYVAENTSATQKYATKLSEAVNQSISYSEMISEKLDKSINYSNNISERLNQTINYSEMISEKLNKTVYFVDAIGENLDKSLQYQDHIAENLRNNIQYSNYLGENLDAFDDLLIGAVEKQGRIVEHQNYVVRGLNTNRGLLESNGNQAFRTYEALTGDERDEMVALMSKIDDIRSQVGSLIDDVEENSPVMGDFNDSALMGDEDSGEFEDSDEFEGIDMSDDDSDDIDVEVPSFEDEGDAQDEDEDDLFGDDFDDDDDDDDEDEEDMKFIKESSSYDPTCETDELEEDDMLGDTDEVEEDEVYEADTYVKVKPLSKIGIVLEALSNNRYSVEVDGVIREFFAGELEKKSKKANYQADIAQIVESVKKREASKKVSDPHFFEFLSEQSKAAFNKLSTDVKEEIVAVAENRTYFTEADVLGIIQEVTTNTSETFDQRLLRNMPKEVRPLWEKLSYAEQQEKLSEATFFNLDSDVSIGKFWQTRKFDKSEQGRRLIAESLNFTDDVNLSDDAVQDFMSKFGR